MPINSSYKSMIQNMGKTYKKGKTICRKLSDGSEVCVPEEAWSVFYGYLAKHKKKDTSAMSKLGDVSDAELEYEHAKSHSEFVKIGDEACKRHFTLANELINRGLYHVTRSPCDLAVEMANNITEEDPKLEVDEDEMLKNKWKACRAMMFRLNQGVKFDTKQFSGLELDEQKVMVRSLARKVRREMMKRGWTPKKKSKSGCKV